MTTFPQAAAEKLALHYAVRWRLTEHRAGQGYPHTHAPDAQALEVKYRRFLALANSCHASRSGDAARHRPETTPSTPDATRANPAPLYIPMHPPADMQRDTVALPLMLPLCDNTQLARHNVHTAPVKLLRPLTAWEKRRKESYELYPDEDPNVPRTRNVSRGEIITFAHPDTGQVHYGVVQQAFGWHGEDAIIKFTPFPGHQYDVALTKDDVVTSLRIGVTSTMACGLTRTQPPVERPAAGRPTPHHYRPGTVGGRNNARRALPKQLSQYPSLADRKRNSAKGVRRP